MKTIYIVMLLTLCVSSCHSEPSADASKTESKLKHGGQGNLTYAVPKNSIEKKVAITDADEKQHITKRLEYWLDDKLVCTKTLYKSGSERLEYWIDGKMVAHKTFYGNGQLSQETPYEDGERHGTSRGWYVDGKQMYVSQFKNGRAHGLVQRWHKNGKKLIKASWKHNKLHGPTKQWDEDGNMKDGYPKFYVNGTEVGEADCLEAMKADATLSK